MVALEVRRNPAYANVVIHKPADWKPGERRVGSQRLISNAKAEAPALKEHWNFLSDGDHFGPLGFSMSVHDTWQQEDGKFSVIITSDPVWGFDRAHVVIGHHTASILKGLTKTLERIINEQSPNNPPVSDAD